MEDLEDLVVFWVVLVGRGRKALWWGVVNADVEAMVTKRVVANAWIFMVRWFVAGVDDSKLKKD